MAVGMSVKIYLREMCNNRSIIESITYLEPARVGNERLIVIDPFMQTTCLRNVLGTWMDEQVIGVAEH